MSRERCLAELKQEQAAKKGDLRMIALKIEDLKTFTAQLFMGETFDYWLVREANIVTFNSFTIDGRIRQGYYSDEELEANRIEELSSWKSLRPFCYSLIKGKKLPESFQITMQLSPEENETFIRRMKPDFPAEQVAALYLNIRYENHAAACVTGTSLKIFTLDKQIEQEWDETVRRYLKKLQIPYVEA